MKELAAKIRTRGFWEITFRPQIYQAHRLPYGALEQLISGASVSFRGWDFPPVDLDALTRDEDWIGCAWNWEHYKQLWRFHRSGQFYFLGGAAGDWRDESSVWPAPPRWQWGKAVPIGETTPVSH